jgi:hypothetical protein
LISTSSNLKSHQTLDKFSGTTAVQRQTVFSNTNKQKQVDFSVSIPYYLAQSGWSALDYEGESLLPHNPLVAGSILTWSIL